MQSIVFICLCRKAARVHDFRTNGAIVQDTCRESLFGSLMPGGILGVISELFIVASALRLPAVDTSVHSASSPDGSAKSRRSYNVPQLKSSFQSTATKPLERCFRARKARKGLAFARRPTC